MMGATELSSVAYFLWKSRARKKGARSWWTRGKVEYKLSVAMVCGWTGLPKIFLSRRV